MEIGKKFYLKKIWLMKVSNHFKQGKRRQNMLVLHRYPGQSIWIDECIEVIILGNSKGATRIGIKAPKEIHIVRDELRKRESEHEHASVIAPAY